MISSSHEKKKNHCFLVESLFGWYSKHPNGPITNPLDPSRILTGDEITELLDKMTKINPKMVTNLDKFKFRYDYVELPVNNTTYEFYHLYIVYKHTNKIYDDLGVIPSDGISAQEMIWKIKDLWKANRLFWPDTELCCRIQLKFKPKDWYDKIGRLNKDLFKALQREVKRHWKARKL
jgi:hypothetical protein